MSGQQWETCRTCAKCDDVRGEAANWVDLFQPTRLYDEIRAIQKELQSWNLEIKYNDGLPQKICTECFSKLVSVIIFRRECTNTQTLLKERFGYNATEREIYMQNGGGGGSNGDERGGGFGVGDTTNWNYSGTKFRDVKERRTEQSRNSIKRPGLSYQPKKSQNEFNTKKGKIQNGQKMQKHKNSNNSTNNDGNMKNITQQFPVSSGQQHRLTDPSVPPLPAAQQQFNSTIPSTAVWSEQDYTKMMNTLPSSSKHLPGQFTGSTGAGKLSSRELHAGPQAWVRSDQFKSTAPVSGGRGMHLLQKMGWKPGEGLGREKSGSLQPLVFDVKLDKRGFDSKPDQRNTQQQKTSKKKCRTAAEVQKELEKKNPVSLLNEFTTQRKRTAPTYELINEGGPSHSRMFLYSVTVNGQKYTPHDSANNKKDAKTNAARFCLQRLGILKT